MNANEIAALNATLHLALEALKHSRPIANHYASARERHINAIEAVERELNKLVLARLPNSEEA